MNAARGAGGHSFDILIRLWRRLSYSILPDGCTGCRTSLSGNHVPFFCDPCWTAITPISGPVCPRCGTPFVSATTLLHSPTHLCGPCRLRKPAYRLARSLYPYESPLREAIHAFKYRQNLAMGSALARLLTQALPQDLAADMVIPVPLAPDRLREREYNQSLRLAEAAAKALCLPLDYLTLRRRPGKAPQTSLARHARLRNLRRAFVVAEPSRIAGRRVLLVDDVFTTGTTANECAKALRRAGSGDVIVVTLARTLSM